MPRRTAGKLKSAKQIAAATKTILSWEKTQAYKNRVSDNWYIAVFFLVMGFSLGLLV